MSLLMPLIIQGLTLKAACWSAYEKAAETTALVSSLTFFLHATELSCGWAVIERIAQSVKKNHAYLQVLNQQLKLLLSLQEMFDGVHKYMVTTNAKG